MGRTKWRKPDKGAEPNLFVDDQGRWIINARIGGKKIERVIGPKHLAKKYLTKLKEQARLRKLFPEEAESREANALSVAQLCARYREADEIANADSANHESMEQVWISVLGEDTRWHEVSIETITAQQAVWLREGKSPARINRYTSRLHKVFGQAVAARLIRYNPVSGYASLQEPSARTRKLSHEEEARLCRAAPGWSWDWILFALLSGFRQGEQFKMERSWVDLETNEIRLPDTKTPKGIKKGRVIPMSAALREVVLRLMEASAGGRWLFPNQGKTNRALQGNFVRRVFVPALESAEILGLHWHDLRRTCGSRLHLAGAPMAAVQAYLGHENSETTDRYIAVAPAELVHYVKLQDALLPGEPVTKEVLAAMVKLQDAPKDERK